jgi:hypothetical protein
MADPTMMQKLAMLLRGQSANQNPQSQSQQMGNMGGMVGNAQQNMKLAPLYQQYSIEMQSNGQQPLSYQQFVQQAQQQAMQQRQQPQQPAPPQQQAQAAPQPDPQGQPAQPFRF